MGLLISLGDYREGPNLILFYKILTSLWRDTQNLATFIWYATWTSFRSITRTTLLQTRRTHWCVRQKRCLFLFLLKSFISFSTGTLPRLRLPAFFPSRKQSWRSWQFCQLSSDCHLLSPHPRPQQPPPPTFSQVPTKLPTGRLARSPSGRAGNTHAAPPFGTPRWILSAGIMQKGKLLLPDPRNRC